jgi:hypothetical protein
MVLAEYAEEPVSESAKSVHPMVAADKAEAVSQENLVLTGARRH